MAALDGHIYIASSEVPRFCAFQSFAEQAVWPLRRCLRDFDSSAGLEDEENLCARHEWRSQYDRNLRCEV